MSKYIETKAHSAVPNFRPLSSPDSKADHLLLDRELRSIKNLTSAGEFAKALDVLSKFSTNPENLNCRGVCLLRLRKYAEAIGPFRLAALDLGTMQVHKSIATHIKINFAIALFFGGFPAGGVSTLAELGQVDLAPGAIMLRQQIRLWEQGMSSWQRLYWRLTRIAPAIAPSPPEFPIGQFIWDLTETD